MRSMFICGFGSKKEAFTRCAMLIGDGSQLDLLSLDRGGVGGRLLEGEQLWTVTMPMTFSRAELAVSRWSIGLVQLRLVPLDLVRPTRCGEGAAGDRTKSRLDVLEDVSQ